LLMNWDWDWEEKERRKGVNLGIEERKYLVRVSLETERENNIVNAEMNECETQQLTCWMLNNKTKFWSQIPINSAHLPNAR
jgi:hypothetical protein